MSKLKIKKGDVVTVITGKDEGVSGKVLATYPDTNKVLVEKVNINKIHKKARKQEEKSAIVEIEKPIDASNVMINCPTCKRPVRIAYKEIEGKKVRVCKLCGTVLDKEKEAKEAVKATKKATKKSSDTGVKAVDTKKTTRAKKTTKEAEKSTVKKTTTVAKKTTTPRKTAPKG